MNNVLLEELLQEISYYTNYNDLKNEIHRFLQMEWISLEEASKQRQAFWGNKPKFNNSIDKIKRKINILNELNIKFTDNQLGEILLVSQSDIKKAIPPKEEVVDDWDYNNCVTCGSKVSIIREDDSFENRFGDKTNDIKKVYQSCEACGSDISVTSRYPDVVENNEIAFEKLFEKSIIRIIKELDVVCNLTEIEFILNIERGSFKRWMFGDFSINKPDESMMYLLNLFLKFPWMVYFVYWGFSEKEIPVPKCIKTLNVLNFYDKKKIAVSYSSFFNKHNNIFIMVKYNDLKEMQAKLKRNGLECTIPNDILIQEQVDWGKTRYIFYILNNTFVEMDLNGLIGFIDNVEKESHELYREEKQILSYDDIKDLLP